MICDLRFITLICIINFKYYFCVVYWEFWRPMSHLRDVKKNYVSSLKIQLRFWLSILFSNIFKYFQKGRDSRTDAFLYHSQLLVCITFGEYRYVPIIFMVHLKYYWNISLLLTRDKIIGIYNHWHSLAPLTKI